MNEEQSKLKLYVLGEASGDPRNWDKWFSHVIIAAESPEKALELCESHSGPAIELAPSHPGIVCEYEP